MHVFTALFTAQFLVTNTTSFELRTTKTSQTDLKSCILTSKSIICAELHDSYDSDPLSPGLGLALLAEVVLLRSAGALRVARRGHASNPHRYASRRATTGSWGARARARARQGTD